MPFIFYNCNQNNWQHNYWANFGSASQPASDRPSPVMPALVGPAFLVLVSWSKRWLFCRKCDSSFKSPKKDIPKKQSWSWNLNFPFTVVGGKFKFQAQDSFLEYFFWRFEKCITLSEKKPPLAVNKWLKCKKLSTNAMLFLPI